MAQKPQPPAIKQTKKTLVFADWLQDGANVWVGLWQCQYCHESFVGNHDPAAAAFPAKHAGQNIDLKDGCTYCLNGTLSEKRSLNSNLPPPPTKQTVKRFDTACSWPKADVHREQLLLTIPLSEVVQLAKALVPDDTVREQLNSFVSNKTGGVGSDTETGADKHFMSQIAKVAHTGQTIPASVFATIFEQTVMAQSSQASPYERVQLLYKYLTTPSKDWKSLMDATGRPGPLFTFPRHLLRACDLAVTPDGEAAARKEWCTTVAQRLIRETLTEYKMALGHREDGDIQHFRRLCTLHQCPTETAADFAQRVRKETESFNNRKFGTDGGGQPAVFVQPLINLLFKNGLHSDIINGFSPPLGDRPIDISNPKDLSQLVEIESRVRRSKGSPATHANTDRHEKDNAQLTQRYDQLVTDYEKGNNKPAGRRLHTDTAQAEPDKGSGKGEDKKPGQGVGLWACWVCKTPHPFNTFCDVITKDPARALKAWPTYLSARYDVTEEQIVKTKMPTNWDELMKFYTDMKPVKKKKRYPSKN